MKNTIKDLLPQDFGPGSKVWIYQSHRLFGLSEALHLEKQLLDFAESWLSHGVKVKAWAGLLFGQFIVLMADEQQTGVSGCSTDSSVRFIKSIEEQYQVTLFDRQQLAFQIEGKVQLLPLAQLNYAMENGYINLETLYFNNLVNTKEDLENNWLVPVKQSWLGKRLVI